MRRTVRYICWAALLFPAWSAFSQVEVTEDLVLDKEFKLYKEHSFFGQIHGNGFGFGFRFGNIKSIYKYNFQEFEFLKNKHSKAEKRPGMNVNGTPRRFIYGALNQLYVLRYGFGTQRTLNDKPYWGGLQVAYTLSGGVALGLAIPQYLSIIHREDTTAPVNAFLYHTEVEKYDPDNMLHNDVGNINGAGPMFKGLFNLRPYPGIYAKFGLYFDFGKYQERVNAIEAGVMVDFFPIPVPMMAFLDKNFFFANFYVAYHFGKRK